MDLLCNKLISLDNFHKSDRGTGPANQDSLDAIWGHGLKPARNKVRGKT
jgi:hypothetical protein